MEDLAMKMYCASTREIDDPELAVEEILEQLNLPENQLANAIGLVAMFGEFYDTGVYSAVAEALPFPCVGYSSSFQGANGEAGDILLSVVMMTSDENTFSVFKMTHMDTFHDKDGTYKACKEMADAAFAVGKPSLLMPYWAMNEFVSNDDMLALMDEAFEQIPMYGSVMFTSESGQFVGFTCVNNEEKMESGMVMVAVYGDLSPNFMVVSGINESVKLTRPAEVTKAISNTLYMINNITTLEYLRKVGAMDDSFNSESLWVLPALVENKETGTSKVRAFLGFSPDDPEALYATGNIDQGSIVTFSQLDAAATNASALSAFQKVVDAGADCFLGLSCVARSWANNADYLLEFENLSKLYETVKEETGKTLNYQIINSGGEICPIPDKNGKLVNALHNYSLAICYF
jgi:hypothetical protein